MAKTRSSSASYIAVAPEDAEVRKSDGSDGFMGIVVYPNGSPDSTPRSSLSAEVNTGGGRQSASQGYLPPTSDERTQTPRSSASAYNGNLTIFPRKRDNAALVSDIVRLTGQLAIDGSEVALFLLASIKNILNKSTFTGIASGTAVSIIGTLISFISPDKRAEFRKNILPNSAKLLAYVFLDFTIFGSEVVFAETLAPLFFTVGLGVIAAADFYILQKELRANTTHSKAEMVKIFISNSLTVTKCSTIIGFIDYNFTIGKGIVDATNSVLSTGARAVAGIAATIAALEGVNTIFNFVKSYLPYYDNDLKEPLLSSDEEEQRVANIGAQARP